MQPETLRDKFAMAALSGMFIDKPFVDEMNIRIRVEKAFEVADIAMEEREKQGKSE